MHYYQFNIGDYIKNTLHLSVMEDIAYRRLLDLYYDSEQPIPNDIPRVSRRLRMDCEVVQSVLNEFFELTESGYRNHRADLEISDYHDYLAKQKANGLKGGRPKKTQLKPTVNPDLTQNNPKHKQTNTNQEPVVKQNRGSRLQADFCLTDDWKEFCRAERSDLDPQKVFDGFKDYWIAKAGQQGVKLDWFATWRNWVRNQKQGLVNKADQVFTTVPSKFERDPALLAVEAKFREAVPMPPEIRAAMERLRK
jgi:uncharacterized protein YdaU (DUF1376 family)